MNLTLAALLGLLLQGQILSPILFRSGGFAPFDIGIDFRGTSGYVTDPAYATYEIGPSGAADYPVTRSNANGQSITFGWEAGASQISPNVTDRNNAVDARLAGIAFWDNTLSTFGVFRVDLPATGTYSIGLGIGDQGSFSQSTYIVVKDGTTAFITFAPTNTATVTETDAAGNNWTNAAAWVSSNVTVSRVFGTTIFRMQFGGAGTGSGNSVIQHIRITRTA